MKDIFLELFKGDYINYREYFKYKYYIISKKRKTINNVIYYINIYISDGKSIAKNDLISYKKLKNCLFFIEGDDYDITYKCYEFKLDYILKTIRKRKIKLLKKNLVYLYK